jgi:2'-5' RNA ligase
MTKAVIRTFIAVETSGAVRQRTGELVESLRAAGASVTWVARHNLHLTLKFLDEVRQREIARVVEAVQVAAATVEPFELEIRGAGAFPSPGRPQTLWLGAGSGGEALGGLFDALEDALGQIGYRKEARSFEPHLTIGRVRGGGLAVAELGRLLREHAAFEAGRFRVAEMTVFGSELTPQGPIYTALGRAPLGRQP